MANSPGTPGLTQLDGTEVEALMRASAWYAKYHATIITERTDDRTAYAVAQREEFRTLYRALRKLGVKMREPEALRRSEEDRHEAKALERRAA